MLYSAKLRTEQGESLRKIVNAKSYEEAFDKAKEIVCHLAYKASLIDVFFVGSEADKRGYYTEEELS